MGCTQFDDSFFILNDAPLNKYSDISDFSDNEYRKS